MNQEALLSPHILASLHRMPSGRGVCGKRRSVCRRGGNRAVFAGGVRIVSGLRLLEWTAALLQRAYWQLDRRRAPALGAFDRPAQLRFGENHRDLLDLVVEQRPDVILLGGDIVDDVNPWKRVDLFRRPSLKPASPSTTSPAITIAGGRTLTACWKPSKVTE